MNNNNGSAETGRQFFWKNQLSPRITPSQKIFDFIFGCCIPIILLILDPFVFTEFGPGGKYRVFSFVGIGTSILALTIWLLIRQEPNILHAFLAGFFFFGTLFAFIIGLQILPLALYLTISNFILVFSLGPESILWGLFAALAFLPLFTAFVYFRNSIRCYELAKQKSISSRQSLEVFLLLGFLFIIGFPSAIHWQASNFVNRSLNLVLHGDSQEAERGVAYLKEAFWCTDSCFDPIVSSYIKETSDESRLFLAKIYKEITGVDIKTKLRYEEDWAD